MNRENFRIVHIQNPNCNDTAYRDYYAIEQNHSLRGWRQYGKITYGEAWIAKKALDRIFAPATKTIIK